MDGEGLLNEELPNCWECPKCYQEDSSDKAQVKEMFSLAFAVVSKGFLWPTIILVLFIWYLFILPFWLFPFPLQFVGVCLFVLLLYFCFVFSFDFYITN